MNTECLPEVIEYFTKLPLNRINQDYGIYREHCACCIGAHIAFLFKAQLRSSDYSLFEAGRRELAKRMDMSTTELYKVLWNHGAPRHPFGLAPWKIPPAIVFERVLQENKNER